MSRTGVRDVVLLTLGWEDLPRAVAYGKVAPDGSSGRTYIVMDRLWRSAARRAFNWPVAGGLLPVCK